MKGSKMTKQEFEERFVEILRRVKNDPEMSAPSSAESLWDGGYLTSFTMVEVISRLETLLGRELVLSADALRSFYSVDRIFETYVADS
jgi:hypothetical protein